LDVAGEEAELLAGLDGGAREDDPLDPLSLEEVDRHRDREVRLSRPRRADGERDVAVAGRIDVAMLADGLRADLLPPMRDADDVGEDPVHVLPGLRPLDQVSDIADRRSVVSADQVEQLVEQGPDVFDLVGVALDPDRLAARDDLRRKRLLDLLEVPVVLAEKGGRLRVVRHRDLSSSRLGRHRLPSAAPRPLP
jgi:hypothetical protein